MACGLYCNEGGSLLIYVAVMSKRPYFAACKLRANAIIREMYLTERDFYQDKASETTKFCYGAPNLYSLAEVAVLTIPRQYYIL
uniref:UDENN domain-containing protein n=1 Tax=Ascaris lumbricoides TaxID=6252 RepID=A0A0M3HYK8_ASCLU